MPAQAYMEYFVIMPAIKDTRWDIILRFIFSPHPFLFLLKNRKSCPNENLLKPYPTQGNSMLWRLCHLIIECTERCKNRGIYEMSYVEAW